MENIKAIVFDFGNVIININVELTFKAFADLTFKSIEKVKAVFEEAKVFERYETGEFSDDDFRDFIRSLFLSPLTNSEIDAAWNALILNIPKERIDLLQTLSLRYPIYLLSNTNNIHIEFSNKYLHQNFGIYSLEKLFRKLYLSYELELWKPDEAIYQFVANDLSLKPHEILFLDDNKSNIISARNFGFQTVLIEPNSFTISSYFNNFL